MPTATHRTVPERSPRRSGRLRRCTAAAVGSALLLAGLTSPAHATDTLPWQGDQAAGAHQPYQHGYTGLDLLSWNPAADQDAELLRSRVPLQERNEPLPATQRNPQLSADTEMFNLAGDYGNAFFESFHDNNVFSQYLFNYWQYTDYYGSWHGMPTQGVDKALYDPSKEWTQRWFEFGMLNLPNAAYTNAAHKNGAKSIATIFFSGSDRGEQTYGDLLADRREDGTYPVADKLAEVARYYGFDGYFVNQESNVPASDVPAYREFVRQLRETGMYVQWYDSVTYPNGGISYQNQFNQRNSPWILDTETDQRISDSIFLNYWFSGGMLDSSAAHATSLGLDPYESVFAGIEAGKDQFTSTNSRALAANVDAEGNPKVSLATLGADFVSHELGDEKKVRPEFQNEVFDRERRWWTGSSTGSIADADWTGISSQIAERSVIDGPSFRTTFNTGHGLEWREAGAVSSDQEWGNINLQDIPVTWQWWVDAASDPLQADFDYGEGYAPAQRFSYDTTGAWEGGSSLVLSGKVSAKNTVRLFKTDLDVSPDSTARVTFHKATSDDTTLALGLVLSDDPGTVVEMPLAEGDATQGWTTVSADLGAFAGHQVASLALVVDGTATDYQVNVGELAILGGEAQTPATPTGFSLDRHLTDTGELVVSWDMADYDSVTNYLLFLDDQFLGGRYDETLYVKKLPASTGTLRLVAVGPDGSRSEAATLDLDASGLPTDVTVEPGSDGTATVSWTTPPGHAGPTSVELSSDSGSWRYSGTPFSATMTPQQGSDSVVFEGVPVDGSRFLAQVVSDGTVSSAMGTFSDATVEPYPLCDVVWNPTRAEVTLARPGTQDWRYLRVTEQYVDDQGQQQETPVRFRYTYTNTAGPDAGANDKVIRGRTQAASFRVSLRSEASEVWVSVEDYAGNTTPPVRIPARAEMAECPVPDPTLPDADRSQLRTREGQAAADGSATRQVHLELRDGFGNPLTGREVSFDIDEALALPNGGDTVLTDSRGSASLEVTSLTAGTFPVAATSGGVELGSADVEFTPTTPTTPAWGAETVYTGGEEVSHQGRLFRAQWWTSGEEPGSGATGAWAEIGSVIPEAGDGVRAWTDSWVYTGGETVAHGGHTWRAKWWTRNQEPGDPLGPWQDMGAYRP